MQNQHTNISTILHINSELAEGAIKNIFPFTNTRIKYIVIKYKHGNERPPWWKLQNIITKLKKISHVHGLEEFYWKMAMLSNIIHRLSDIPVYTPMPRTPFQDKNPETYIEPQQIAKVVLN
jgi:hypothetical protein